MVVSHGLGPFFKEKLVASLASLPQNATNWRGRWIKACNIGKKGCWLNILFYCELGYSGKFCDSSESGDPGESYVSIDCGKSGKQGKFSYSGDPVDSGESGESIESCVPVDSV